MTTTPVMPELPDGATVLPDGSAFAIASFPLPSDHWLYAPREYRDGEEEPIELPSPILSHQAHGDIVRAAIRYAVRSATMCGKEPDFDPDALVQNAMYALCGPFGGATLQAQPAAAGVSDVIAMVRERYRGTKWGKAAECICDAVDEAILALRPQSESDARRAAQEQLYTERERHTAEVKRLQAEIGRLKSERPQAAPVGFDVEAMIRSVLPGGNYCDPQAVADAIRDYVAASPQAVPMTEEQFTQLLRKLKRSREVFQAGRDSYETACAPMNSDDEAWFAYLAHHGITAPAGGEGQSDR